MRTKGIKDVIEKLMPIDETYKAEVESNKQYLQTHYIKSPIKSKEAKYLMLYNQVPNKLNV